jgi:hypothetical protein
MLQKYNFLVTVLSVVIISGCGVSKKMKLLEEEKSMTEQSLLKTKEDLSLCKRNLNKLRDSGKLITEEQNKTIETLTNDYKESQKNLSLLKEENKKIKESAIDLENKISDSKSNYKKRIAPFLDVQKKLNQQHRTLNGIHADLKTLLENSPGIKYKLKVNKNDIKITFDNSFLFEPKRESLTENGRWVLFLIGEVMKKRTSVNIRVSLYTEGGDNEKWKFISMRLLSIFNRFRDKEISAERLKTIINIKSSKSTYTEIVLGYPDSKLLKLIPLR